MKGQDSNPTGKILGIQHRRKQTAEGEARPTMVFDHLLQTVSPLGDEDKEVEFAKTGMQVGDKIAMVLGGSGDPFAYALGLRAQALGGETAVYRLPPFIFKERREEMDLPDDKTDDARLLALLLDAEPELFYKVKQYDMDLIWVKELTTQLFDTMKDRIACETRIRQRVIGTRLIDAGMYPQGKLEDAFKAAKANDIVFLALEKQEGQIERRLAKKLKKLPVFTEIFDLIDGVGPRIAARFISGVIDIRRFKTSAQLKAYCGVHCLADGSFARKRKGQVANWRPDIRQGLYQLSKQFEFRPNSYWGKRYRAVKARLRVIHPEIVVDEKSGKQKYTDAHINKMAKWRTLSLFVVYIFKAWKKLDAQAKQQKPNLELMDEHVA